MTKLAWAVLILGLLALLLLSFPMHGVTEADAARREDTNNLRNIVGLVVLTKKVPLRDGAFDPYAFFLSGEIRRENLRVFESVRSKAGPTDKEIKRGDYTNFPWERYRGDGKLVGAPFPLLWEKKPDKNGMLLVGLSDGTAKYWDHATLEAALKKSR